MCGAYALDRNYWTAAGFQGSQFDFERCVGQRDCAEETVRRYLTAKAFDCNEDGTIGKFVAEINLPVNNFLIALFRTTLKFRLS